MTSRRRPPILIGVFRIGWKFLRFRRIRTAIFLSSALVAVIAILGAGAGFLRFYDESTRQAARDTSIRLTELISRNLESILSSIQSYVSVSATNIMRTSAVSTPESMLTEHMLVQELIYSNNIVDRVLIVRPDGSEYFFDRSEGPSSAPLKRPLSEFVRSKEEQVRRWWGSPYWFSIPGDRTHVYLSIATFQYAAPEYTGIVTAGVPISYFESQYQQYPAVGGGQFFVFNRLGKPTYGNDASLAPLAASSVDRLSASSDQSELNTFDYPQAIATAARPSGQLLTFVTVVPKVNLFRRVAVIQRTLLATGAVSAVIAFLLAWALSSGIARDLRTLAGSASSIAEGDLDHRISLDRRDEIQQLAGSFNVMIGRLGETVEQLSDEKARTREAEFRAVEAEYRALQASIDPHFLNNVLESINALAKIHGQPNISGIVTSLSYLLRRSIADERRFITLEQEIEYAKNYMALQTAVTGQRIETHIEVAPESSEYLVPKLLLQPLVENAVKHGLSEIDEGGVVSIVAFCNMGLHIVVSDNGWGIPTNGTGPSEYARSSDGFGMLSVKRRIELLYPGTGSVQVVNSGGRGTRIEILLPIPGDARQGNP